MNSIEYFKHIENAEQNDIYEGTDAWFNPSITKMVMDGHQFTKEGGTLSASISTEHKDLKLFCASLICRRDEIRDDNKILDERVKDFGDTFLVIYGLKLFFERLTISLNRDKLLGKINYYRSGKVEYIDKNNYDGEHRPFRKPNEYAHQKEWRLLVSANVENEYIMNINNIEDISFYGKTKCFKNIIEKNENEDGYNLIFN